MTLRSLMRPARSWCVAHGYPCAWTSCGSSLTPTQHPYLWRGTPMPDSSRGCTRSNSLWASAQAQEAESADRLRPVGPVPEATRWIRRDQPMVTEGESRGRCW
jgi:hypothetical protein